MIYERIVRATFIERENRFVARVRIGEKGAETGIGMKSPSENEAPSGEETRVHVKNTGRCRELLVPGATVYLEDHTGRMAGRKLRYSLVAVDKILKEETAAGSGLPEGKPAAGDGERTGVLRINMDSQAPNKVVGEALRSGRLRLAGLKADPVLIRPETRWGDSRFDFYLETETDRAFLEVKGVTLEENGVARFPDAPTLRGVKHIEGLIRAREAGYRAYILFVIQMEGMKRFEPNDATHPGFGEALRRASKAGVGISAIGCRVGEDFLTLDEPVEVRL